MDKEQLKISQNYLKSSEFVSSLISRTKIKSNDVVVEIGPGRGIITQELLKKTKHVIAIEYDEELVIKLKNTLGKKDNIEIIKMDFLEWKLPKYSYKVFSNIPFNMTADIVTKLLESSNPPEATYLIIQDKAAERFIGEPVGDNSQTSILLKPFFDMGIVTKISRNQFEPRPSVDTVLAKFIKREYPLIKHGTVEEYRDFVVFGYNQWKPTILEAFEDIFSYKQTKILKKNLEVNGKKPTQLDIDTWIKLFDTYIKYVPDFKKEKIHGSEKRLINKQKNMTKKHRTRISR